MDALELLRSDHQKVKTLFNQLDPAGSRPPDNTLVQQIRQELNVHTALEENIFYPACEKYAGLKGIIQEAYKDHLEVKTLLNRIGNDASGDDTVLHTLIQDVERHVQEEESRLFPLCQKIMPRMELEQLGRDMEHAKHQAGILRQGRGAGLDY